MSVLIELGRRFGGWLLLAVCASVVSGLSNASLLAVINHSLSIANSSELVQFAWKFVLLALLMLVTRVVAETTFMALGQGVKARLRQEIVQYTSETSWLGLEKLGMPKATAVLTQDLDTLVVFFVNLPNILIYGAIIVGCLIYLGLLSWPILLLALLALLLGILGYRLAHGRALTLLRQSRQREDVLIQHFKKLFDGGREYKLSPQRRRRFVNGPLADNIEQVRRERTRGYVLYGLATNWGSILFFAFIGCVLYLLRQYFDINNTVMTGYTMVFLYMIVPVEGLLSALPSIGSARIALQRIQQVRDALPKEHMLPQSQPPQLQSLALKAVSFDYQGEEGETFRLGPLDLHFSPGELVYLVGGNGSGKTTLAYLLIGLYPPQQGAIELNGQPISPEGWEVYRQYFAVVFNDFFLFDELDELNARTQEQAQHLLQLLKLDHKVTLRDGRFSTTALSQGQRKRLALLLAWLQDRPFYLFDEWAADQDPIFKAVFYQQLLPMLQAEGKTILVITHDDRYFHLADRIIKLESGQLVTGEA